MDLPALERASLDDLESLYREPRSLELPRGRFAGRVLCRLENRGARLPLLRGVEWLGFEAISFGIDFDQRLWFFTRRRVKMGRFAPRIGHSRWRDTETVQLHYDVSRLPQLVTRLLYDEVKPLSDDLCLGLGGVRAARGLGDHFFFALTRHQR